MTWSVLVTRQQAHYYCWLIQSDLAKLESPVVGSVSIVRGKNIVTLHPVRSGVAAVRGDLREGSLANRTTGSSSDRQLRALH